MEKTIKRFFPGILLVVWVTYVFRSLILKPGTTLFDWGDSSYIAWQIITMRDRILALDWGSLPNLNQHYPYPLSAFYSDSFVGQAIMAVPLFFIKNPVLLYNCSFFITLILNYLAGYWLFKRLGMSSRAGILGTFFLNNSFFFFDQLIHLQTLSYWPTLLLLYFLSNPVEEQKIPWLTILISAFFLAWQFYLSIYLGIFALAIYGIFVFTKTLWQIIFWVNWQTILKSIFALFLTGALAGLLIYPLYLQYKLFEQLFHQVRDINEILINSTHITDFLFLVPNTILTKLPPVTRFQLFNHHVAAESIKFPGVILLLGTFIGLFFTKIKSKAKQAYIIYEGQFNFLDLFFIILLVVGFVFALGPRLNANGHYLEIPLPYLFFLNKIHVFSSIRLVHRWIFLSLLPMVYFATKFYPKLPRLLLFAVLVWFVFESVPLNLKAEQRSYLDSGHLYLAKNASPKDSLLEFPFLNLERGVPVDYETRTLLASVKHHLQLFNGYTGLFIADQGNLRLTLEKLLPDNQSQALLESLGIDYLKVNKQYLSTEKVKAIIDWYRNKVVLNDSDVLLIKIGSNPDPELINKLKVEFIKKDPLTFGKADGLVYLRLNYHNSTSKYIANLTNRKVRLEFKFFNNQQLVDSREYTDLYPLVNYPHSKSVHLVKFKETAKYNHVEVRLFADYADREPIVKLSQ